MEHANEKRNGQEQEQEQMPEQSAVESHTWEGAGSTAISRRKALKLGAAGIALASMGLMMGSSAGAGGFGEGYGRGGHHGNNGNGGGNGNGNGSGQGGLTAESCCISIAPTFAAARSGEHGSAEVLKTIGHTLAGIGSAEYVRTGATGTPDSGDEGLFYDGDGIGWRLLPFTGTARPQICPEIFGAIGDGVADDTVAVNKAVTWNNFDVTNMQITVLFRGIYNVSSKIIMPGRTSFSTLEFQKSTLRAIANMDAILELEDTACITINGLQLRKAPGVAVPTGIRLTGIRHFIHDLSGDQGWESFIHMINLKESHLSGIRLDNDVQNRTGTIIKSDYSVNNTITRSFIGYAHIGLHCTTASHPVHNYKSEGIKFAENITVYIQNAVKVDFGTAIDVVNNVLDFCSGIAVFYTNGQNSTVSQNWIASIETNNFIGVGSGTGYANVIVTENHFVRSTGAGRAVSLNSPHAICIGNTINNLDFGFVRPDSIVSGNHSDSANNQLRGHLAVTAPSTAHGQLMLATGKATAAQNEVLNQIMFNSNTVNAASRSFIRSVRGTNADQTAMSFWVSSGSDKEIMRLSPRTLHVEVAQAGKGIALVSPDGLHKKVLTLDNSGNPVWTTTE